MHLVVIIGKQPECLSCMTFETPRTIAHQASMFMEFSRQKYGVGSLSLLLGLFLTQESNQGILHCRWIHYQLNYQGSPFSLSILSKKYIFKKARLVAKIWKQPKCPSTDRGIKKMQYILQENAAAAASLQFCPTLCDPIDGSPPDSPIPGILQARTLEWVAISFSNA